jgi:ABC-2 type transport system permease protein
MPSLSLLRNEITKAARRKLPYFGFVALLLGAVVTYFIAGQLSGAATNNGWGYVGFAMQLMFSDIGPIFLIVFAAMLVAEETGNGTIRAALAAPVQRWELYLAKALTGVLYMLAFSLAALLCSLAFAHIHYHFDAIGDAFGVVYSRHRILQELLLAYVLSWVPLTALVMYGLLISTLIRTPGAAVSVAITTFFLIDLIKHLVGLDPYIFTRYLNYSWLNLQQIAQGMDYQWRPEVWKMLELCSASALLTFGVGLVLFVRRDLNH